MAEILGTVASAITLAGAFSSCIQAFEAFYIAKEKRSELRTLFLQFKLQEARLWIWGKEMGWVSNIDGSPKLVIAEESEILIKETLRDLFEIITDTEALRIEYGCRLVDDPVAAGALLDDGREPSGRLAAVFENFRVKLGAHPGVAKRIMTWVVRDRTRFKRLVKILRNTISDLKDVSAAQAQPRKQDEATIRRLHYIDDGPTLDAVAEATEQDWPEVSEAASRRSEKLSSSQSEHRDIKHWIQATDDRNFEVAPTDDMESWNLSECKRQYLRLYHTHVKPSEQVIESEIRDTFKESDAKAKRLILFKDAIGRQYRLPFECCSKWKDMQKLITQMFQHIDNLADQVNSGHYDLVGPDKEIILPQCWESIIEPKMQIKMMLWPLPEPESVPLVADDDILNLDDILNGGRRSKPSSNCGTAGSGKSRSQIPGGFSRWMLGGSSRPRPGKRRRDL